jgi:hypothetical protein
LKLDKSKEHFVVVYNKDFDEANEKHLTAMDAYVYITMKLMAGNVYANNTVYATADSICSFSFTQPANTLPRKFIKALQLSLERISDNGYIPHMFDFENKPFPHIYDISAIREKDLSINSNWKGDPYTLVPISSYNKILAIFNYSETMKIRLLFFYIKITSMIGYKTGVCTYSLDVISEKTNLSITTVQEYIGILEDCKVLTVYHMGKNIYGHANYPTNVLGQYYNKDIVLKYGKSVFDAYCMQYKLDKNGRRKRNDDQQASA